MKKLCTILLLLPVLLFSQDIEDDYFDDLFSDPEEDVIITETPAETVLNVVETTELFSFSGNFGGTAGIGFGLIEANKGFSTTNTDFLLGATADSALHFSIKPDSNASIEGTFEGDIDDSNIGDPWSNIALTELFLEYNVEDIAIVSFGKMSTSVATDFIDKADGTSFLLRFPTVLSGLNFYANADDSTMVTNAETKKEEFDFKRMLVASWFDVVLGQTRLNAGIRYKKQDDTFMDERFGFLLGAQSMLWNINVFAEAQYFTLDDDYFYGNVGAYYIGVNTLSAIQYDAETAIGSSDALKHSVELGFRYTNIFDTKLNVNLASKYQIDTKSGFIAPAISMNPYKYVTVSFAIPYIFGDEGFSVYDNFLDGEYSISLPTELSILASVSVKIPF